MVKYVFLMIECPNLFFTKVVKSVRECQECHLNWGPTMFNYIMWNLLLYYLWTIFSNRSAKISFWRHISCNIFCFSKLLCISGTLQTFTANNQYLEPVGEAVIILKVRPQNCNCICSYFKPKSNSSWTVNFVIFSLNLV